MGKKKKFDNQVYCLLSSRLAIRNFFIHVWGYRDFGATFITMSNIESIIGHGHLLIDNPKYMHDPDHYGWPILSLLSSAEQSITDGYGLPGVYVITLPKPKRLFNWMI